MGHLRITRRVALVSSPLLGAVTRHIAKNLVPIDWCLMTGWTFDCSFLHSKLITCVSRSTLCVNIDALESRMHVHVTRSKSSDRQGLTNQQSEFENDMTFNLDSYALVSLGSFNSNQGQWTCLLYGKDSLLSTTGTHSICCSQESRNKFVTRCSSLFFLCHSINAPK